MSSRDRKKLLRILEAEELEYAETPKSWALIVRGRRSLLADLSLEIVATGIGVALLAASARLSVKPPFSPVPFTLQTLVLNLLILLRGRNAWRTVLAYILLGLLGLPIFAYGGGPLYVLSPTMGYIIGFLAASLLGFFSAEHSLKRYSALSLVANAVVYLFGWLWLSTWLTLTAGGGFPENVVRAAVVGVAPFVLWDVFKAVAAALTAYYLKPSVLKLKILVRALSLGGSESVQLQQH